MRVKKRKERTRKRRQMHRESIKQGITKNYLIYYSLAFIIVFAGLLSVDSNLPKLKASYNPEALQQSINETSGSLPSQYTAVNYYLDFSPSMQGFFDERIDDGMKKLSNIFPRLNESREGVKFYKCIDTIRNCEPNEFYESMTNISPLRNLYDSLASDEPIENEESDNNASELVSVIKDIDLGGIFYRLYEDNTSYADDMDHINVIISDLVFTQEQYGNETEGEIFSNFAALLGEKAANANISIYHIYSTFAGEPSDEYILEKTYPITRERSAFYLIVLSKNDEAYYDYIQRLEEEMASNGIVFSENFQLTNRMMPANYTFDINMSDLLAMDRIKRTNFNYDNLSFEGLKANEIGLCLIKNKGQAALEMPVTQLNLAGYYDTGGEDHTEITVKTKVSDYSGFGKYEEYTGNDVIPYIKATPQWLDETLYLKLNLEINPTAQLFQNDSWWIERNFAVIELQYFLNKASYSYPQWVSDNENMQNIMEMFERIIRNKETSYDSLEEYQKYLGTMILYITY